MLWNCRILEMITAGGKLMNERNQVRIGQATYEINRVFSEKWTVSDVIREIIVKKSKEGSKLT